MVRPDIDGATCVRCKGSRLLCGKRSCPILLQRSILKSKIPYKIGLTRQEQDIFGASPPAVFVGHQGYPHVNIGPLIPINEEFGKDTAILDSSEAWFGKSIDEIINYRVSMVRSNFKMNVKYNDNLAGQLEKLGRAGQKLLESTQELAMASNSVDTESHLSRVRLGLTVDAHAAPSGAVGDTTKIDVIDNVKVPKPVDYVVYDEDLNAAPAIFGKLYLDGNITQTGIQRLFSAGLLGQKQRRKIVPTRWTITAIDDIISKGFVHKIRHNPTIDKYYSFYGEYLDNRFLVLLIPGPFMFEMMECWNSGTLWTQMPSQIPSLETSSTPAPNQLATESPSVTPTPTEPTIVVDTEFEKGRKTYASNVTGAYYAAKKEVSEFLWQHRKTASIVVIREVQGGYLVPLGVWVIRETVKQALSGGFQGSETKEHETLWDALNRTREVMSIPPKVWYHNSPLLKMLQKQTTLDRWLH